MARAANGMSTDEYKPPTRRTERPRPQSVLFLTMCGNCGDKIRSYQPYPFARCPHCQTGDPAKAPKKLFD